MGKDERLSPAPGGVLPVQILRRMAREGTVSASRPLEPRQFQPSSLDLRLGSKAYRIRASFLPQDHRVEDLLGDLLMYEMNLESGAVLETGRVYLIPLLESVRLPDGVAARANPRSSTGRLDVFTRLITDRSRRFDEVASGYAGPLYLEVFPRSFPIRVRSGISLNQMRLTTGRSWLEDRELEEIYGSVPLLSHPDGRPVPLEETLLRDGLFLSLDLRGRGRGAVVGYKALRNSAVIDMARRHRYRVTDFWQPIPAPGEDFLILEPEEFYILGSRERIRIPPGYAAEMIEFDAGSGELRTHYAGFFDSGFGYGRGEIPGTRVVLEVRPHDVPFKVEDGQVFFKVRYDRMLEEPEIVYGDEVGSSYAKQTVSLSAHFLQDPAAAAGGAGRT
jgi:dCTP deaminase